jgi:hypothetical protein
MKTETNAPARTVTEPDAPARIPVAPHDGMYVCQCECADIEGTEWVHLNSGLLVGSEPPSEDYWCPACEDHQCRVVILDADGTNAGDEYHPFKLLGAAPEPVGSATERLVIDTVRFCCSVADDHPEPTDALRRIRARLERTLSEIDAE